MANAMVMPKKYFFDDNGNPLAFGKIYTYKAGTVDEEKATYTTPDAGTPNANPIILNEQGYAPIYLIGSYYIVVHSSTDEEIWTEDNVTSDPSIMTFDSITDMLAVDKSELTDGQSLFVVGYYDGSFEGGGHLYYDAASNVTADNGLVFGTGPGQFKRVLDRPVSFEDFGAVGDGLSDDYTYLQAALSSGIKSINGSPYQKTYLCGTALSVPLNFFIDLNGCEIKASSAFTLLSFANGGGIKNGSVTGSVSGAYNGSSIGIACEGTNNEPSAPTFVEAPEIENVTVSAFGFYGVFLAYTNNGHIKKCDVSDCGYTGIGGVSCNDLVIDDNNVSDITPGSGAETYGIFVDRKNGASETGDPRSYRVKIINNTVRNVTTAGDLGQGIDTHAGVDFLIDNNIILGCNRGIDITNSVVGASVQTLAPKRCIVTNNILKDEGAVTGRGVILDGANTGSVINDWCEDCIVANNTIEGYGSPNSPDVGALILQQTKNCRVEGNQILRSKTVGIHVNVDHEGLVVSENTIVDPYDDTYSTPACIRVSGSNSKGSISSNHYRFEDATLGTYVAVRSIRLESSLTGLDLEFGKSTFEGIDATHLEAVFNTTTGVNYAGFYTASGSGTINLTTASANGNLAVVFPKVFPYAPKIFMIGERPINNAGDPTIMNVDSITKTGFTAFANNSNDVNFPSNGTQDFLWVAM